MVWTIGALLLGGAGVGAILLGNGKGAASQNLLYHTVELGTLDFTVVERGALESSENKDVIVRVKASKGGQFATTIKWVIDDGKYVKRGQHLATLDSAALEDQYRTALSSMAQARSNLIQAESTLTSTLKQNVTDLRTAESNVRSTRLAVEKFVGLPRGTLRDLTPEKRNTYLEELEQSIETFLAKHKDEFPDALGEYHQLIGKATSAIDEADGNFQNWKDRYSFSQRMQIKGYQSQSQVQSDEFRLSSAAETLKNLQIEKKLLQTFTAQQTFIDLANKLKEAEDNLDRIITQNKAKQKQAEADLEAKQLIFEQEEAKVKDIEEQIRACKIHAPQEGMVVYYVPEQSRFGSGSQQSTVAQGEPVREGQRLMRIPDLRKMQVNTRIHEAMISRIQGDIYEPTWVSDSLRAASLFGPRNHLLDLCLLNEEIYEDIRTGMIDEDFTLKSPGQVASIRVDAFPSRLLKGRVKSKAAIASQQDLFSSDVRVYVTLVTVEDLIYDANRNPALRPGMSAEVTINVGQSLSNVMAIPIQAIFGGGQDGTKPQVYVKTDSGPKPREIEVGSSNGKLVEIRSGLSPGDQVVINPKAILGDSIRTRDEADPKGGKGKGKGGAGGGGGGQGGSGRGGPPSK